MSVPKNGTSQKKENNDEVLSQNNSCEASLGKNQSQNGEKSVGSQVFRKKGERFM